MSAIGIWAAFAACLLLILFSGTRLSRYGDLIAARTGLGGVWIGLVLVAGVTSLPELVTGLSSVLVVGQPDLAVGDALGSCVFNLLIIVLLDSVHRRESIYTQIHQGQVLSAGFGVVLLGVAASLFLVHGSFGPVSLGRVGPYTPVAIFVYFIAIRSVFFYERREREAYVAERAEREDDATSPVFPTAPEEESDDEPTLRRLYGRYAANAAVVVVAGIGLPVVGEALAITMGWERTFVGTTFLALATSVPEIVISVEAVRLAAVDMAIGNLLGSNLFDLLILGIDDLAYGEGPLMAAASGEHLFTAVTAMTMTGVVVASLTYRPRKRVLRLAGWTSFALLALAMVNALILFLLN